MSAVLEASILRCWWMEALVLWMLSMLSMLRELHVACHRA